MDSAGHEKTSWMSRPLMKYIVTGAAGDGGRTRQLVRSAPA
jgi:hypothetical protein